MDSVQTPNWMGKLSQREIEILRLISDGLTNREISQELYLSLDTIKWYNKQIFNKLAVSSRTRAVKVARQYRLLDAGADLQEQQPVSINNLPAQLTSYVGRAREIAEIKSTLKTHRLVVLTGAGGTGKTRLAIRVAGELQDDYRDGVWMVELASLSDPNLVPAAIAQVLKVIPGGEERLIEVLKRSLKRKQILLLLDNFEHLLEVAPLVSELLASAPQLTVLATSRERLHIYGEYEVPVHPLAVPDLQRKESAEQLLAYEAVDLFIRRARAAQPGLVWQDNQISAAARICVRLDGLPLAIELAASQVKIFPPAVLAQRLAESFEALPIGPRDLPARQRTLRQTIEWSYNLLKEGEKRLFIRLGVFSGGVTLESIERICGHDAPGAILEPLTALVDKNLVFVRESPGGEPRFVMLETIREYARERLAAEGQIDVMHGFHAAYFADLAELAEKEIRSAQQDYWLSRLGAERDNLYSALAWSLWGQEATSGLRIVAALQLYWYYQGNAQERYWVDQALERLEDASPHLQAGVLNTAGGVCYMVGDFNNMLEFQRRALNLYRQLSDERNAAWAAMMLSLARMEIPGEIDRSIVMTQESLTAFRKLGDKLGATKALTVLGEVARMKGDLETARRYYEEGLELSRESGLRVEEATLYVNLGFVAYYQEDYLGSLKLFSQGLVILEELHYSDLSTCLSGLAGSVAALGYPERAARLLGTADALQEMSGVTMQTPDLQDVLPIVEIIRQALGEIAYQKAWEAGWKMTTQDAVSYALSDIPGHASVE